MLVLMRKVGEEIRIGDDIFIVVTEVKGEYVRLGITAPKETSVMRTELLVPKVAATDSDKEV